MAGNDIVSEIESSKERHQLLVAAAGSGKTRTLIHLLARLIRKGRIDPFASEEEVIVFTFTNKAAEELVVRLSKLLGQGSQHLNAMFVGTIHGWCNDFLKSRGSLASTKILDELERTSLSFLAFGLHTNQLLVNLIHSLPVRSLRVLPG